MPIQQLKTAFKLTTPDDWEVNVLHCPEQDDDPMGVYVIDNKIDALTSRYNKAEDESEELEMVHAENAANAEFIALAHNLMPVLLESHKRAEQLEKAITIIGQNNNASTKNLLYDTLDDVGYFSNGDDIQTESGEAYEYRIIRDDELFFAQVFNSSGNSIIEIYGLNAQLFAHCHIFSEKIMENKHDLVGLRNYLILR